MTEKDWTRFTNPIFTSKTELDAWLRAADGEVHESAWDRRSETSTDLSANPSGQLSARNSYASKPSPNQVNRSGSSTSQGNSPNTKTSPKTPPVSDTMATRRRHRLMSGELFGGGTPGGGLFGSRVLDLTDPPLTKAVSDAASSSGGERSFTEMTDPDRPKELGQELGEHGRKLLNISILKKASRPQRRWEDQT